MRSTKNERSPLFKSSLCELLGASRGAGEGLSCCHFAGLVNQKSYIKNPSELCYAKPTSLCTREALNLWEPKALHLSYTGETLSLWGERRFAQKGCARMSTAFLGVFLFYQYIPPMPPAGAAGASGSG